VAWKRSAVWLVCLWCVVLSDIESGDGVIVTVSWFKVMCEVLLALRGATDVKGRHRETTEGVRSRPALKAKSLRSSRRPKAP
jgi:hypothetical protein